MARSKLALRDFLSRTCKIIPSSGLADDDEMYVFDTSESRAFMTESHLREVLRAVGQEKISPGLARKNGDTTSIIIHQRKEPEIGIDTIKIPLKLIAGLSEEQAFLVLRNLEGIKTDIDEGKLFHDRIEALFGETATVTTTTTETGARIYNIKGKLNSSDRRLYMERYAEHVASKTLFDVAKALNAQLSQLLPEEARDKFFVEGRDLSDRKVRYGEDVGTELVLTDEGAWTYSTLAARNPNAKEIIVKVFQQAMLDPFGLSMKHYMGKHNVLKAGKRPLVKVSGFSGFLIWVKSLFGPAN